MSTNIKSEEEEEPAWGIVFHAFLQVALPWACACLLLFIFSMIISATYFNFCLLLVLPLFLFLFLKKFFIVVCVAFCFWLMEYLKKKSRVNSWLRPRNSFRGDRNETVPTRSTWFSQCRVMFLEIYIFSIAVVKELVNMQMRLCFRGSGAIQVVSSIESRCFRTILKGRFFVFDKERSSN